MQTISDSLNKSAVYGLRVFRSF
jgi:hypothetical protein